MRGKRRGRDARFEWFVSSAAVLLCLAVYIWTARRTGFWSHLHEFDSVMTADMAQIAENMSRGQWMVTRYLTPASWSIVPRISPHPDFIRYPVPIHMYTALGLVFADLAAAIKCLNMLLYGVNAALAMRLARSWLADHWGEASPRALSVTCAAIGVFVSLANFAYLKLALSDAYEVMATTLMLLMLLCLEARRTFYVGVVGSLLYLCRPNLGLLLPFFLVFSASRGDGRRPALRRLTVGGLGASLLLGPLLVRSYLETCQLFSSLQSRVELAKGVVGAHASLYRSFEGSNSAMDLLTCCASRLLEKIITNVGTGWNYLFSASYWPVVPGCVIAYIALPRRRRLVVMLAVAAAVHLVVISAFLQLKRAYAPLYVALLCLSWTGAAALGSRACEVTARTGLTRRRSGGWIAFATAFVFFIALSVPRWRSMRIKRDGRANAPSAQAVERLRRLEAICVYSNVPFWIPRETDLVAMYAPVRLRDMRDRGPSECTHFLYDRRRALSRRKRRYLKRHSRHIERGRGFELFLLR